MNVLHSKTPLCEKHTGRTLARRWNSINWKEVKETVNRLQTRIAKALQEGKLNLVKRLQYLLTHSYHAKLLAVWIVATNKGKNSPGIDGEIWSSASSTMKAAIKLSDKQYPEKPPNDRYLFRRCMIGQCRYCIARLFSQLLKQQLINALLALDYFEVLKTHLSKYLQVLPIPNQLNGYSNVIFKAALITFLMND